MDMDKPYVQNHVLHYNPDKVDMYVQGNVLYIRRKSNVENNAE